MPGGNFLRVADHAPGAASRPYPRLGRFPSSDGMSTAQGIRANPVSESTIRRERRAGQHYGVTRE
jgi:hypothetical protein